MLLSRILRKFSYYFAVNKFQSIGLCIIITIIFGLGIINIKLDVFFLFNKNDP